MKCEDFILHHETGSAIARWRAKQHARHCPQCAQAQQRLADLRDALSVPAELTPYHRHVWERAAADVAPVPAWSWLTGPRLALAGGLTVAAVIIVAILLSAPSNDVRDGGQIADNTHPPRSVEVLSGRILFEEVAQLESGLQQVEDDLKRLTEEAALLEARRAISELAALYPPIGSGDSS